jgi:hypothetical protein
MIIGNGSRQGLVPGFGALTSYQPRDVLFPRDIIIMSVESHWFAARMHGRSIEIAGRGNELRERDHGPKDIFE